MIGLFRPSMSFMDGARKLQAEMKPASAKQDFVMKLPLDIGPVHFIGIGGIGMSGIAEVMLNLGYIVQGSDQPTAPTSKDCVTRALASRSVMPPQMSAPQSRRRLLCREIRKSGARAARAQRLPVVRRAEMLAEMMRLKSCVAVGGTHGKTTTTSMVAALLDAGGFDPTVINGGIINAYGTNARLGAGEWMVVEADESDGTFVKLPADIAIVTNIDAEHLDYFKSFEAARESVPRLRRKRAVLWIFRAVRGPSGGAETYRPHRGSAHYQLRRKSAVRCAAC